MDGLTVGRIVHYIEDGKHLAALVVKSDAGGIGPRCGLAVFREDGEMVSLQDVRFSDIDRREGTWHFPERV